ncbi:MAG: hypothetical protein O3A46_05280 [Candidatus Poribacteria bacterium]|nr:hypothetical protein [Candidatus Poribacteria bacterium]
MPLDVQTRECRICERDCRFYPKWEPTDVGGVNQASSGRFECNVCGSYFAPIGLPVIVADHADAKKHIISGWIRERNARGDDQPELSTSEHIDQILGSRKSLNVPDKMDHLLCMISALMDLTVRDHLKYDEDFDYPLAYAANQGEFVRIHQLLQQRNLLEVITVGSTVAFKLTADGWERAEQLKLVSQVPDQCFVAMSFDPSMRHVYDDAIQRAIKSIDLDASGSRKLRPFRIDDVEHNQNIPTFMLDEIQKSLLLVADVTGQNQGVYFEAGYALGHGIPVIFTCDESDKDNRHFDTEQYNHIFWKDPDDLRKRLERRIRETIAIQHSTRSR